MYDNKKDGTKSAGVQTALYSQPKWYKKYLIGLPLMIWLFFIIIAPVLIMFVNSFYKKVDNDIKPILNFGNYIQFFTDGAYIPIFLKTLLVSLAVSISAIILAYPLAFLVSRKVKRMRNQLYMLILVPLWVSYLVRIIAWRTILGRGGVINTVLLALHIINEPLSLFIYNPFSVFIALTHITLPFVFISIFSSLEKIPKNLINAAADLGANGARTFKEVIFPLSMPGVFSGFTMAFVTSFGDYIIPQQLGGPNGLMFGNIVVSQFGYAYNWPLGAALGFIMFSIAVLILATSNKVSSNEGYLE